MYTPPLFQAKDEATLVELCQAHPFGIIVATDADGAPEIAHLPLALVRGAAGQLEVLTHVARANPLAALATKGAPMTAVFLGPHGYVSPTWYAEPRAQVPTWNYAVVHAVGTSGVLSAPELRAFLDVLSRTFEGSSTDAWRVDVLPPALMTDLMRGIVGIRIAVTSLTGKLKLSQNRSEEDRERVAAALRSRGTPNDLAMLALMPKSRA
jgi:transcriptional regulator